MPDQHFLANNGKIPTRIQDQRTQHVHAVIKSLHIVKFVSNSFEVKTTHECLEAKYRITKPNFTFIMSTKIARVRGRFFARKRFCLVHLSICALKLPDGLKMAQVSQTTYLKCNYFRCSTNGAISPRMSKRERVTCFCKPRLGRWAKPIYSTALPNARTF
jgi:hypothetical protein